MLFVHEIHRVMGQHEEAFEEAFRAELLPALGADADARLLYFMRLAHGTGRAYNFVTLTAVTDGSAWERVAHRLQLGDLRSWAGNVDQMRWDVTAKVLAPAEWSPLQSVDFEHVPTDAGEHDQTLFMEDTAWSSSSDRPPWRPSARLGA